MTPNRNVSLFLTIFLLLFYINAFASEPIHSTDQPLDPVESRSIKEDKIPANSFAIVFYKPTYILPYYYTGSPYNKVYQTTPTNESIKSSEIKYQLSFKVPVWRNILHSSSSFYLAYTQLSYWQAYNHSAFFRETDYEPEIFLANEFNIPLTTNWKLNFINLGAVHQSNGFGGNMERSWNRIYLEAIASRENWMISIKPWYVINDSLMREQNPNITDYLGYGIITIAFKFYGQVLALQTHNLIEGGGKHATAELTYSFPITPYLKGYVQVFSGYGQSLIEYNHRTNSAGIGISLSNWI